jgi:hypothetical protein
MRQVISRIFSRPENQGKTIDLDHLTHLIRRYTVEQQQVPRDLVDLVALNYLESVPIPPPGQKFVIDRKAVEIRLE